MRLPPSTTNIDISIISHLHHVPVFATAVRSTLKYEYGAKALRIIKTLIVGALVASGLATIFGMLAYGVESPIDDVWLSGCQMLFDFVSISSQSDAVVNPLLFLARWTGVLLVGLLLGIIVAILTEPVNIIDFSRFATLSFDEQALVLRYWIKQPEGEYLFRPSIDVMIIDSHETNRGTPDVKYLFRWEIPKDEPDSPQNQYFAIRGVRYAKIPFSAKSAYDSSKSLQSALDEVLCDYPKAHIAFRIGGTKSNGSNVFKCAYYTSRNMLYGYKFVPIRKNEIVSYAADSGVQCSFDKDKPPVLYFEHFNAVMQEERIEASGFAHKDWEKYCADPDSVFVLGVGECMNRRRVAKMHLHELRLRLTGK